MSVKSFKYRKLLLYNVLRLCGNSPIQAAWKCIWGSSYLSPLTWRVPISRIYSRLKAAIVTLPLIRRLRYR